MNNFGKKIVGLFVVMILMVGGMTWGQEIQLDNNSTTNSYNWNTSSNTNNNTVEKPIIMQNKSLETPDTGLKGPIICPDNTKRIDDKGCRPCSEEDVCCGIKLNTNVPFIGNCIELSKGSTDAGSNDKDETRVTEDTAFPRLMGGLSKILVSLILLISFMGILVGGVMISASGGSDEGATKGKKIIGNVISALALLGASGVILRLINPNFFG